MTAEEEASNASVFAVKSVELTRMLARLTQAPVQILVQIHADVST